MRDATTLRALAARCREATEPSRELDAEIFKARAPAYPKDADPTYFCQRYTASLDAIVGEIERSNLLGATFTVSKVSDGEGEATVLAPFGTTWSDAGVRIAAAHAATPALALCAALLEALAAKEEGDA